MLAVGPLQLLLWSSWGQLTLVYQDISLLTATKTIFISAIFCLLTPIGGALTQTWEQLFITRLLMGIGMGLKGSSVPIFAAENSPAKIRGALGKPNISYGSNEHLDGR